MIRENEFSETVKSRIEELKDRMGVIQEYGLNAVISVEKSQSPRKFRFDVHAHALDQNGYIGSWDLFQFGEIEAKKSWIPGSRWSVSVSDRATNYTESLGTVSSPFDAMMLAYDRAESVAEYVTQETDISRKDDVSFRPR
jgi:hypothetical protein